MDCFRDKTLRAGSVRLELAKGLPANAALRPPSATPRRPPPPLRSGGRLCGLSSASAPGAKKRLGVGLRGRRGLLPAGFASLQQSTTAAGYRSPLHVVNVVRDGFVAALPLRRAGAYAPDFFRRRGNLRQMRARK